MDNQYGGKRETHFYYPREIKRGEGENMVLEAKMRNILITPRVAYVTHKGQEFCDLLCKFHTYNISGGVCKLFGGFKEHVSFSMERLPVRHAECRECKKAYTSANE